MQLVEVKVKDTFPEWQQSYGSTLSLTVTLGGGGWSVPHPGSSTPGKETQYALCRSVPRISPGSWATKLSAEPCTL
jgi:hypothetical protein